MKIKLWYPVTGMGVHVFCSVTWFTVPVQVQCNRNGCILLWKLIYGTSTGLYISILQQLHNVINISVYWVGNKLKVFSFLISLNYFMSTHGLKVKGHYGGWAWLQGSVTVLVT